MYWRVTRKKKENLLPLHLSSEAVVWCFPFLDLLGVSRRCRSDSEGSSIEECAFCKVVSSIQHIAVWQLCGGTALLTEELKALWWGGKRDKKQFAVLHVLWLWLAGTAILIPKCLFHVSCEHHSLSLKLCDTNAARSVTPVSENSSCAWITWWIYADFNTCS